MHPDYKAVIGLEIHAQLKSESKIYCADKVTYGEQPNTFVSPISLGHPGTLPTLNEHCLELAIKMGLAMHCTIAEHCYFARKNYFYPDLPKGYQISQDKTPICTKGYLDVRLEGGQKKRIGITRIHMEEDAGKSLHDQDLYDSLIDLNRASVGLIEIVSEPDIENAEQAMAYMTEVRKLVRYLDICDGNMEEGSLRCDANVSVMKKDAKQFGTRAEVKNMNSISNVGRAINYEIERQIELLEGGGTVLLETRTWDAVSGQTYSMRTKEEADDYRYFPEPDLQPLVVTSERISDIEASMPELPDSLYERFTQTYSLPEHDATLLTEQREFAQYYLAVLEGTSNYKAASNWLNGPVKTYLNEHAVDITAFPLPPASIASLVTLVDGGKVSFSIAKEQLFNLLLAEPKAKPEALAKQHNLLLDNDADTIATEIEKVLDADPENVATYLEGKTGLLGHFMGQVMKATKGKADPKLVNKHLRDALEKRRT